MVSTISTAVGPRHGRLRGRGEGLDLGDPDQRRRWEAGGTI
jgi:hypothetical protein